MSAQPRRLYMGTITAPPPPLLRNFFVSELNFSFRQKCSISVFSPPGSCAANFSGGFLSRLARRTNKRKRDYSWSGVRDNLCSSFFSQCY